MSGTLRLLLLFAALLTAGWILYKIRKLKVKMEDAIFWMIFAGILCVLGLFPHVTYWLTDRLGIMSPANLIFLVIIFLLLEKVFTLSIIVSQLEEKVTVLSAEVALRSHAAEKRLDTDEKKEKEIEILRPIDMYKNQTPQTYPILIKSKDKNELYHKLNEKGFGVVSLYHTMIEELRNEKYDISNKVSKRILNLPVHQDVEEKDLINMCKLLKTLLGE